MRPGQARGGGQVHQEFENWEDWKQFRRVHRDGRLGKAVETFDPEGIRVLLL